MFDPEANERAGITDQPQLWPIRVQDREVVVDVFITVYGNLVNLVTRGAGYMQAGFYKFVQPGRNRFNAAFCVGTNVTFRRTAIDEVGGIYTDSKSEDVWTSVKLHRAWLEIRLHSHDPGRDARRPSRPTPSSSSAGPPGASRSCSRTTRSARGAASPWTSGSCTSSRRRTT